MNSCMLLNEKKNTIMTNACSISFFERLQIIPTELSDQKKKDSLTDLAKKCIDTVFSV